MPRPVPAPVPSAPAIRRLAGFVANAEIVPGAVARHSVRDALIDTMACILFGSGEAVSEKARAAYADSAQGPAPVYGTTLRLDRGPAALINAIAAHAMDFDDWDLPANAHPSAVLFPAILAAAAGSRISGQAVAHAYIAGFETLARIGEAANFDHYAKGWHSTGTLGAIGAAAAVARLWALDADRTANALSIAVSRASGYTCQFGSNAKPLQAGFAAETGVMAATFARHGMTGQPHVLDAPSGFNALTAHGNPGRFAAAFDKLGGLLALDEYGLLLKVYPSCGYTHRIIDCAIALKNRGIDPAAVRHMLLELPDFHGAILPFRHPRDRAEALFSLPFCAAQALVSGDLTLADYDAECWTDGEIRRLIDSSDTRMFTPNDPTLNYDPAQPDRMTVTLADGTVQVAEVPYPLGSPQNPVSFDRLMEKVPSIAGPQADRTDLEDWMDAADIAALIRPLGDIE